MSNNYGRWALIGRGEPRRNDSTIAPKQWRLELVQVSAGPLDRAVDRSMRSVHDEQPHVRPADDLEVRLGVREAPGVVAGRKELSEAVVGSHLQREYPPPAGPTCREERLPDRRHAAAAAVSSRVSARRSSRETCIWE